MKPVPNILKRFLADRSGATAVEYGMIVTFVSMVIIGGIVYFGDRMEERFLYISQFLADLPTE